MEPFDPIVKGDKLYGRGTQDMKSALAVMVYSVIVAKELSSRDSLCELRAEGGEHTRDDEYVNISSMLESVQIIANLIADKDLGK